MPKVLIDGALVDVPDTALFNDDGQTPFVPSLSQAATGQTFTADDVARIRGEEKDKLYGQIAKRDEDLTALRDQVGSLTAAEQRREAQLEQEKATLEAAAKAKEEEELDAKSLIQRREQEWQQQLQQTTQTWEQKFAEQAEKVAQAEATAAKEREFGELRDYAISAVKAVEDKIAPQLLGFVGGNTPEEIDASIVRAIETTDSIAAEMQAALGGQVPQQQPFVVGQPPAAPQVPGTRVTTGPSGVDPGAQYQQLTAEQIASMPMDQYAKLRGQIGIGGQSNNRGLFG